MAEGRRGRDTLLNDELQADFVKFVELGCYPTTVAESLGVAERTYHEWMQRGRRATERPNKDPQRAAREAPYAAFYAAVSHARGQARRSMEITLISAAQADGKLALEYLARTMPKKWGNRLEVRTSPQRVAKLAKLAGVSEAEMFVELAQAQSALLDDEDDE